MIRAYLRVSSEDQKERGTIESQEEFLRKYCDLHNLTPVKIYRDEGVSGTIPLEDRDDGKRLLNEIESGDLILLYKLDRLGRSARVVLNAVHQLEQIGVKIKSMTEPFDTSDPAGRFMLTMLAGVADLERETILERMWHGANRVARTGKWMGGIVPYGYRTDKDGFLVISEDPIPGFDISEADVVRMIYKLLVDQDFSCVKIADYLNALGVPPVYLRDGRMVGKRKEKTAGVWLPGRIRNMVTNTVYKGIHYYGKRTTKQRELIPRSVPAIVTEEQWDAAQLQLRENQIMSSQNRKRDYLLTGIVKCGICGLGYVGTAMKRNSSKGGLISYYKCGGKQSYRGKFMGRCKSKNVPHEWLDDLVWNYCVDFIEHPDRAAREIAAAIEGSPEEIVSRVDERETIQRAIESKDTEKESILDLYRRKIIDGKDVERQLDKIAREAEELRGRIREIDQEIKAREFGRQELITMESVLSQYREAIKNPTYEAKRQVVKGLVKEVVINTVDDGKPHAEVKIRFRFAASVIHTDKGSDNQHCVFLVKTERSPIKYIKK